MPISKLTHCINQRTFEEVVIELNRKEIRSEVQKRRVRKNYKKTCRHKTNEMSYLSDYSDGLTYSINE